MVLGPLGQNRGNVLCHDPNLTNCIEDGSSAVFPRTSLLLCILWSNVMWKNQTLSGAQRRRKD